MRACSRTKDHWSMKQASEVRSPSRCGHCAFGPTTSEHCGKWMQIGAVCRSDPQSPCRSHTRLPRQHPLQVMCNKFRDLPEPFCLKSEPNVPYSIQIIVRPALRPPDQEKKYFDILKHIYLRRNKVFSKDILTYCHGHALRFDWGQQVRTGFMALNYMFDRMGGMQIRLWTIAPKFEKKVSLICRGRGLQIHS